jgi:hypothetical protein
MMDLAHWQGGVVLNIINIVLFHIENRVQVLSKKIIEIYVDE